MVFNYSDIKKYAEDAPKHYIGHSFVASNADSNDIQAMRKFLIRETKKYNGLAWLLSDSTTESWGDCERYVIHTSAVGRPHTKVKGKRVSRHIHLFTIATDDETNLEFILNDIKTFVRKRTKKKPNIKQPKSKQVDSMNYVSYMCRQSDHIYSDNHFDWDYFNHWIYDDKA